ncbi:hypothetical protein [Sphingobacterium humi]|uniref:DUF4149 domain-containing protein n=1 Tax=Sphingobacterium humi TaxID=1796905 RepID=A0A6N8L2G3_9SPHI|nr:hypothetical protein [Sphingobacterium humi]MVZ63284.1 hypothetical protein [Sphingobacterium humi]
MKPIYFYFASLAILLFLIAIFQVSTASNFSIQPTSSFVLTWPLRHLVLALAGISLLFALLYRFSEEQLYSHRWSIMHFICLTCLCLNVYTWQLLGLRYLDRLAEWKGNPQQISQLTETFQRIQSFYILSFLILVVMQSLYFLNLGLGLYYQKSAAQS